MEGGDGEAIKAVADMIAQFTSNYPVLSSVSASLTATILGARFVVRSYLEERIKAPFLRELEAVKAELDGTKQRLLKDYGLFADKRLEVCRSIYVASRLAYQEVNRAARSPQEMIPTHNLTLEEFGQLLDAWGADLIQRRELLALHSIAQTVASAEFWQATWRLRVDKARQKLEDAQDAAYTNIVFMSRDALAAFDAVKTDLAKALLIGIRIQFAHKVDQRDELDSILDQVPSKLMHLKRAIRADLLGANEPADEAELEREQPPSEFDPRGIIFADSPRSVPVTAFESFKQLVQNIVPSAIDIKKETDRLDDSIAPAALVEPVTVLVERAKAAVKSHDFEAARDILPVVLRRDWVNRDALLMMVEVMPLQQVLRYRSIYEPYVAAHPGDLEVLFARAMWNRNAGSLDTARAAVDDILSKDPAHIPALGLAAELYRLEGNVTEALASLATVMRSPEQYWPAQMTRLEILADLHRWHEITKVSEQTLKLVPNDLRIMRAIDLIGHAHLYTRNFNAALNFCDKFQAFKHQGIQSLLQGLRSEAYLATGDFEKALACTDGVGRFPSTRLVAAKCLARLERWSQARDAAVEAHRLALGGPSKEGARQCREAVEVLMAVAPHLATVPVTLAKAASA